MPLFDYHCDDCERTFESVRPRTDYEQSPCPECGELADKVERVYGDHQIEYGCDGFHRTDYDNKETQ